MPAPRVSIVIPTYNRAALLRDALEDLRRQTRQDFEVLVVDDARTTEPIPEVVKAFGPQATYLQEPKPGVSAARNLGIRHARAPLVAFMDSDDRWLPHKLERQLEHLRRYPHTGLLYARMWSYDIRNPGQRRLDPPTVARTFTELLNGPNTVTTSTVLVRRECFAACGVFNPSLRASEDHELWLRIARRFAIGFIDEPLAEYRRNTGGINSDHRLLYEGYRGFYEIVLSEYRNFLNDPKRAERLLAKFEYLCGTEALKRGEARPAIRLITTALRRDWRLGSQFATTRHSRAARLWLQLKPYAALTVSALKSQAPDACRNRLIP